MPRHTCHCSRALRPQRDTGRTSHGAVPFPPSCPQTGQVPSSASVAEAGHCSMSAAPGLALVPTLCRTWGWLCSARNTQAQFIPPLRFAQGLPCHRSPGPACACRQLRHRSTLLPVCAPFRVPRTATTAPTGSTPRLLPTKSCRYPGTHRSPALLGKPLRFDSDDLELRGGSLQGEAARSGLPGEWEPRVPTTRRQGPLGQEHSREADSSFQIYPHF